MTGLVGRRDIWTLGRVWTKSVVLILALTCGVGFVPFTGAEAQEANQKTPILPISPGSWLPLGDLEYNLQFITARGASGASVSLRNVGNVPSTGTTLWFWIGWYDQQKRLFGVRRFSIKVDGARKSGGEIVVAGSEATVGFYRLIYFGATQPTDAPRPRFAFRMTEPARSEMVYATPDLTLTFGITQQQIVFSLRNSSPALIRLLWDESAYVDQSSRSHRVMHEGIRFNERDRAMPPSIVPPGSEIRDILSPTDYVMWTGSNWIERPLYMASDSTPFTVGVFLTLEVRGQKAALSFRFTATGTAWPTEITEMFGE